MKKEICTLILCLLFSFSFSQGLTLPYNSGFDSAPQTAGWQQFRQGNDPGAFQWNVGGGGFSASCLSHDYNVGANSTDTVIDWYVSPPLNFTFTSSMAFKVKTSGFSTPTTDNCEVWFGTDDPDPSTGNFVLIGTLSFMQPQFQWLDTTLDISTITDSGYVAFRYKTIGAAWMTYAIDNISITLDAGAGIFENSGENNLLNIYPNPFNSSTNISINGPLSSPNHIVTIVDLFGRELKRIQVTNPEEIIIERDNLSAGIYFVELLSGSTVVSTKKIVVE